MVNENGKKVCVTGGTGFLGSWMIKRLLEDGYAVNATVRLDPGLTGLFCLCVLFGRNVTTLNDDIPERSACIGHAVCIEGGIALAIATAACNGIDPDTACLLTEGLLFAWWVCGIYTGMGRQLLQRKYHLKIKAKGTLMEMVGADWLRSDKREDDLGGCPGGIVQKYAAKGGPEFFFIVNIQVDLLLESGEYFLSDQTNQTKKWQEKQEKQAAKVTETKRKREETFL